MSVTPRLALPFLSPGQAQKELWHNEALQRLDILVAAAVDQPPLDFPPQAPVSGESFIVGPAAVGVWQGKENCLAAYCSGGWRFIAPVEGMTVHVRSSAAFAVYRSGRWELGVVRGSSVQMEGKQVVGVRAPAITTPAGGTVVDTEARAAIAQILSAMRDHGLIEM